MTNKPMNTCQTCKYWLREKPDDINRGFAICDYVPPASHRTNQPAFVEDVFIDLVPRGTRLYTRAEFGCTQHKPRSTTT